MIRFSILMLALLGRRHLCPGPALLASPCSCGRPRDAAVRLLVGRSTVIDVGIANRARLADERRCRRRAGHLADAAADQRQDARHDLDVRLGPRRRDPAVRSHRPARSRAAAEQMQAALSGRERSRSRATARTSCCRGHGVQQGRRREGRERRRRLVDKKEEVVTLLQLQEGGGPPIRCCCASALPKSAGAR